MKALLCTITFLLAGSLVAQPSPKGLVVDYNLYDNIITYKLNGEYVDKPTIKKGDNIYIQISEFNAYALEATVTSDEVNYDQTSMSGDPANLAGGGLMSGVGSLFSGLNMGSSLSQGYGQVPGSRGASTAEVARATSEFQALTSQLMDIESRMDIHVDKIEKFKTAEKSLNLASTDIEQLKTNLNVRPSRIKALIDEEIRYAFLKSDQESIEIKDILHSQARVEELVETVEKYKVEQKKYEALAKKWSSLATSSRLLADLTEDQRFQYIISASDSVQQVMQQNLNSNTLDDSTINFDATYIEQSTQKLAALRQVHEELKGDLFSYKFPPLQADGDEIVVHIDICKKTDNGCTPYKRLDQRIAVLGGWKVTAGIGLAFNALATPGENYSIINDIIVAESSDQFVPAIASFAHVFRQRSSNINLAASFGIGLPIFSDGGGQSASFYLGPTLMVGSRQKFLVTAGISGSRVNRLGGGLKVGDSLDNGLGILPTQQRYELGYFLSISYDLLN